MSSPGFYYVDEIPSLLKPAPATEREAREMEKISLEDYTIYYEKLDKICEEAKEVFIRSGVSTMILSGDLVIGVYTAGGDMATSLCGAYIHSVSCAPIIKWILKHYSGGIHEGDIFFVNDPLYGTVHAMDMGVIMPVFDRGELVAWAAALVHENEIGGTEPGMSVLAKSRYDEGLKMMPVKIGSNYQLYDYLIEAFGNMSRTYQAFILDTKARAAACDRIRIRLEELCKEKGADFVKGLMRRIIAETEKGIREKFSKLNDGVYRESNFLDTTSREESLIKVGITIEKKGGEVWIDFSESSLENTGGHNCFAHATIASICNEIFMSVLHDVPVSAGIFSCLHFRFRKGTFLHANPEKATNLSVGAFHNIMSPVHICFAKMLFASEYQGSVTASVAGKASGCSYAGLNQWGHPVADLMTTTLNTMGMGGKCDRDGVDSSSFPNCIWGKALEIEDMENEGPWIHLYYKHLTDSGGHGRYRGGAAVTIGALVYHVPEFIFLSNAYGSKISTSKGVFGGYPDPSYPGIILRNTNILEMMKKSPEDIPFDTKELLEKRTIKGQYEIVNNMRPAAAYKKGDIFVVHSAGAGGYGDALERDPNLVMKDLKAGLISEFAAREVYKVAYDRDAYRVDSERTEELRRKERDERKRRGKTYEEFEKEWSKKRPPADGLRWYGPWPKGCVGTEPVIET